MSRPTILKLSPLALVLALPLAWSPTPQPDSFGPPFISLEAPANPMDPDTRDAAFLVHAYHHDRTVGYPVSGTAEGLVDGQRRTIELDVRSTSRAGVFAVQANWPDEGHWVLKLSTNPDDDMPVTLVAELGPDGGLGEEAFFGRRTTSLSLASIRVVTGRVTEERVDTALRAMAGSAK